MPDLSIQQSLDLGLEHHRAGRLHEAEQIYRQVLAREPNHPWAIQLLGMIAHQVGNAALAIDLLRRAIAIDPNAADFHGNLGEILRLEGRLDEAEASFQRCLALNPRFAPTYSNLGEVYRERKELGRAAECSRKAIELEPGAAAAYNNLGIATHDMGDPEAAIALYQRALALQPNYPDAMNNLATSYLDIRRVQESLAAFRRAIQMAPTNADAHCNLSYGLLLRGDFEEGWDEYEWRWRCPKFPSPKRNFKQPLWSGEDIRGQRVLVHAEQGLGDTIQFARYLPRVAERGAHVIFECKPELMSLMKQIGGVEEFVTFGQPLPEFDWQIPMLSLARAFHTKLDSIPASIPYLNADARLADCWRKKLETRAPHKLRVGLVWAGSAMHDNDFHRSIALSKLAPLAKVPGVEWHNLQFGDAAKQARPEGLGLIDLTGEVRDFSDSAALLSVLDLLITVDTSAAHLAGAMGRPVWVMLPFNCDWRWMLEGESTPWYPTMRLFRQETFGTWENTIARVASELSALLETRQL